MAANQLKDLFIFGPFGKKPLKEQVTPHKIALMVLIHEYIAMRRRQKPVVFIGFGAQDTTTEDKFKEREKRDFMTSILKLIQVYGNLKIVFINFIIFTPIIDILSYITVEHHALYNTHHRIN